MSKMLLSLFLPETHLASAFGNVGRYSCYRIRTPATGARYSVRVRAPTPSALLYAVTPRRERERAAEWGSGEMASCFQLKATLRPLQSLIPAASSRRSPHILLRRLAPATVRCASAAPPRRSYNVTILPGDGIGPEVVSVARDVLSLAGSHEGKWLCPPPVCSHLGDCFFLWVILVDVGVGIEISFREMPVGGTALDAVGVPLPEETLSVAKDSDAVLLGAIGGSVLCVCPLDCRSGGVPAAG